ncbi:MAG: DUF2723 domain-containing protein [Bacteroidetes bacterium]|nr:MAG: DUF2723 domain-containing protein [Bacteroidota bacterium]REK04797.1 MAG: DUF2723 domain-containing protein [Bacteroidota bacterium]REK36270.1 MAG: DUF2723 domain-containing protein [Bacteroidota bacterium]REK51066.1 MAG: DUF2723 domain-containing protein [Bacteroidota bacterium]
MNYQRINNLLGWIVFLFASYVYIDTIEPTASFWDCGEFIATAHKLEVGHPPGAPLFLMLGRVFILFAGDNVSMYPIMVNILSALMSSFTILFLFWTITALARKIFMRKEEPSSEKIAAIMAAGLIGALSFTFTDSFWFSAVEAEVYSSSSFFTAIVFWLIFKWENVADEKHNLRWLILIAYLMGLSIGVHLLNLLTIPALAFVYYFRKYTITKKGIIYTAVLGMAILAFIQYGIIQTSITLAGKFDLLFVNSFGLPFGSGIIFYALLVIVAIIWGLHWTKKNNHPIYNTAILCTTFILIGYTSFAQIVIRSNANPPLDENNPENVFTFISYLKREQYGERPLFYGHYYNAKVIDQKQGDKTWAKIDGEKKYVEAGRKIEAIYEPSKETIFPRMWSSQQNHINEYKKWAGIKGDRTPTFGENLKFFFTYQLGEMYWRYFMWNFVGRQNDIQGPGGITRGNWISGIKAIDEIRLGPQDKLPKSMTSNKAMNKMYFLPFILGLVGLFFHFTRDKKDAWVVMLLFFFTGIAIVIYLNGTPLQPRERDYAYAGSYYAFAIWIGLGMLAIYDFLRKKLPGMASVAIAFAVCMTVPTVLAKAQWDDHDRSDRYTARDFASNYLNSCEKNAILFTNGDNDTFPLWYVQEVENVRTDVRVVNLSLLNTDWYIDQLLRKYYDSDPITLSWTPDKYRLGRRDYIPYFDKGIKDPVELKELVDFMGSDAPGTKARTNAGDEINYYPTKNIKLTVNAADVLANGVVSQENAHKIVPVMTWSVDGNYLMKNDLMILNILANNNWKRPIYFATTVGSDNYLNLEPYFQLEGLTYRVVPILTQSNNDIVPGRVETSVMYDNVMNKFLWGNMNKEHVYLDENNLRMTTNFRINFSRLAEELLLEGKRDSAIKVLDKCVEVMPDKTVPYNFFMTKIAELYYRCAGEFGRMDTTQLSEAEKSRNQELIAKANAISERIVDIYSDNMNYYLSLKGTKHFKFIEQEMSQALYIMQAMTGTLKQTSQKELAEKTEKTFMEMAGKAGI